ncbi:S-methylmethionine-dependent homocysteine/selenocysteine methylase [Clostridium algifaecis]|uniref:S-methylmethionine-dependent homocysteine/selenocysteine methylase n=1 Tax=Clostridium algifaecis TaxID=1472040 RepID=A0ABS4KQN8_9CLOT|nr:homocysteine S-methyltransferase family protein [Clostridium algifaecis]MBP2031781.1 S-methylmethionine-dependent homocysteine/selenocysteine methylase [Clostridium algifaecis]
MPVFIIFSEKELFEFHRPRIKLLVESGVDILACETIPSLKGYC